MVCQIAGIELMVERLRVVTRAVNEIEQKSLVWLLPMKACRGTGKQEEP